MSLGRKIAVVAISAMGLVGSTLLDASAGTAPSAPASPTPAFVGTPIAASASPSSCYTQMNKDTGIAISSQDFEIALDAYDSAAADDFRLKKKCTVSSVDVVGEYYNGAGPALSQTVTIYKADLTTVVTSQTAVGTDSAGSFSIPLTPVTLAPGTYWLSVRANMDYSSGGQWGWHSRKVLTGKPAMWRNPNGGFGTGCNAYELMQACLGASRPGPDLVFGVNGPTFTPFDQPTEAYLDDMCLADPSDLAEFSQVTSVAMPGDTCMVHTVSFSTPGSVDSMPVPLPLQVLQVPSSWPSWGAPPFTQTATPTVLYTQGATSVQFDFGASGQYAGTNCKGGLEVQPSGTATHDYKGEFRDYLGNLLGTVYVSANGNAGARLLGAATTGDPLIKTITVTDISTSVAPTDFAVAQIHDCAGGGALGSIVVIGKGGLPTGPYRKATCSAKYVPADEFTIVTSLTLQKPAAKCQPQTVTFEGVPASPLPLQILRVPTSWPTWGLAGAVESTTPYVLSTQGATSVLLTYGAPNVLAGSRKMVGAEVQPDVTGFHVYMAEFRDYQGNLLGTVYKTASNPTGAELIAGKITSSAKVKTLRITDITPTSTPSGFAIAQVRASKS